MAKSESNKIDWNFYPIMLLLSIFNGQLSRCHIDKQMTNNYQKKIALLGNVMFGLYFCECFNSRRCEWRLTQCYTTGIKKCAHDKMSKWQTMKSSKSAICNFCFVLIFFASTQNPSVDCSLNYARSLEIKITIIRNKLVSWTSTKHETRNVMVIQKNWHLKMVAVIHLNSLVSHFLQTAIKTT